MKRARWILLPFCALLSLVAFAPGASAATGTQDAGSLLYVQQVEGGSLRHLGRGAFELELTGVSPRVSTFTDRPRRRAGSMGVRGFVGGWGKAGFAADPPNAALVLDHAPGSRDVALLTLSHPRYDRRRHILTYRVQPLHTKDTGSLAGFAKRADPVRSGDFGSASLFIDNGALDGTASITVSVGNVTPGTPFKLTSIGAAWTVPPSSSGFGGLKFVGNVTPLVRFSVGGNAIVLETAPQGQGFGFGLEASLALGGTTDPILTVEGAECQVTWPTAEGKETAAMAPGSPLKLLGIVAE